MNCCLRNNKSVVHEQLTAIKFKQTYNENLFILMAIRLIMRPCNNQNLYMPDQIGKEPVEHLKSLI